MKKIITTLLIITIISIGTFAFASTNGTITSSGVNVRDGAGTNYNSIATLNTGDKIAITSDSGDWYKININGTTGYVNKKFVSQDSSTNNTQDNLSAINQTESNVEIGSSNDVTTGTDTSNSESMTKIIKDSNLYALPLLNSTKIEEIKKDESVSVISVNGDWVYVYTQKNSGWIFINNLDLNQGNSNTNSIEQESNQISENAIDNTENNDTENKIAQNSVETSNENTVRESTNTTASNSTNTTTAHNSSDEKYPKTMYVNVSAAFVRSSPSSDASKVTSVGLNCPVNVLSKQGEWYSVEVGDGKGYMKAELLSENKK